MAKFKRKPPLPARVRWPRVSRRNQTGRKACPCCGTLDRAVSTRSTITYYGPSCCDGCGRARPLRKAERPIDWELLAVAYAIPRELKHNLKAG